MAARAMYRPRGFVWLFSAILILLVSYPYYGESTRGAFVGGAISLLVLSSGVYAVRTNPRVLVVSSVLAALALGTSIHGLVMNVRGSAWTEGVFTLFYAFTTLAVFVEVIRVRLTRDAIFGIVCVYLLIGLTFGSMFDLVETLRPGSFGMNVPLEGIDHLGFRTLLFYSFMTLTSIGYGDITPLTTQAQSLAILEGVAGVFYVAVLVARIVNAYEGRGPGED